MKFFPTGGIVVYAAVHKPILELHAPFLMDVATGIYVYTASLSIQSVYPQLHLELEQTKAHAGQAHGRRS